MTSHLRLTVKITPEHEIDYGRVENYEKRVLLFFLLLFSRQFFRNSFSAEQQEKKSAFAKPLKMKAINVKSYSNLRYLAIRQKFKQSYNIFHLIRHLYLSHIPTTI